MPYTSPTTYEITAKTIISGRSLHFWCLTSVLVLPSFESNSLDIFCFIFSWPHHSPSLIHFTLGFLNTGRIFSFSVSDCPLSFFLWISFLSTLEYENFLVFCSGFFPHNLSLSHLIRSHGFTDHFLTNNSLISPAQHFLWSFRSVLSMVSWTF